MFLISKHCAEIFVIFLTLRPESSQEIETGNRRIGDNKRNGKQEIDNRTSVSTDCILDIRIQYHCMQGPDQ